MNKNRVFIGILFFLIFSMVFISIIPVSGATKTITYSPTNNRITAVGGDSNDPITFKDIYNADKAGEFTIVERTDITSTDASAILVNETLRPTDYVELGGNSTDGSLDDNSEDLWLYVYNWAGSPLFDLTQARITINGSCRSGYYFGETITFFGAGTYYLEHKYHNITSTRVSQWLADPPYTGSFAYKIIQGQWGEVWNTGDNQYRFDCFLYIGNNVATTYFEDINQQVTFQKDIITASWQHLIYCYNYVTFILGEIQDESTKQTAFGCQIKFTSGYSSTSLIIVSARTSIGLYSCYIYNNGTSVPYILQATSEYSNYYKRIWNCVFHGKHSVRLIQPNEGDIYNMQVENGWSTFVTTRCDSIDDIRITDTLEVFNIGSSYIMEIKNIYARGLTRTAYIGTGYSGVCNLTNADLDKWSWLWAGSAHTGEIFRKYELDLTVITSDNSPLENATITINHYGINAGTDFNGLTDSNGQIPTQELIMGFYNATGDTTIYNYNPYHLRIEYEGLIVYETNFTLEEKIDWVITLQDIEEFEDLGLIVIASCFGFGLIGIAIITGKRKKDEI